MKKAVSSLALSLTLITTSSIIGCSGHPGAGHWQSKIDSTNSQYSAVEVEFDGKGTLKPNQLHVEQEGKADLWCVWQAKSAVALEVNCGDGSEEKTNLKFELAVTGQKQEGVYAYTQAQLLMDGELVSELVRKP